MAIYTKAGDKGETKVFDKKTGQLTKISKISCKIEAIGDIDELNSFLGVAKSFSEDPKLQKILEGVQENLFVINSILAGSKLKFSGTQITKIEKQIDKWEGSLPVQKNFIFYGGGQESSLILYSRALARRAERSLIQFAKAVKIPEAILTYMNRISDFLFMLARAENHLLGFRERHWRR